MTQRARDEFAARFRIDFKLEAISDPATGQKRIAFRLDPARYEIRQDSGESVVFDRLDNFVIALSEVRRMLEEALAQAPTGKGQSLGDGHAYIASRRELIKQEFDGIGAGPVQLADRSAELLAELPDGIHGLAVLSLDIVDSTKLSEVLDAVSYARVTEMVLRELAAVVPFFNGHILKFTGDGVLAYFPVPSFLTANDNAIDCALTMRGLVLDALNPNLAERGHPIVRVRIGIESGGAVATTVGHPASKSQRDLIGRVVNIACKIQQSAEPNQIRIGQAAYQNMNTMWKLGCTPAPIPSSEQPAPTDTRDAVYVFSASGAIVR